MIFKRAAIWSRVSRTRNPLRAIVARESEGDPPFRRPIIITDGVAKRGEEKAGKWKRERGKKGGREKAKKKSR